MGWKEFRKSIAKRVSPVVCSPFMMPCGYRCPVCNSKLKSSFRGHIFVCKKCGYSGPVFVKPETKRSVKKK